MIKIKRVYKQQKNISLKTQSKVFHYANILTDIKLKLGKDKFQKLDIDSEKLSQISSSSTNSFLEKESEKSLTTLAL